MALLREALGGVAEGANEVLEALLDRGGVVEPPDDGLGLREQLVADQRDPALPLRDQSVGAALGLLEVAVRLLAGLLAEPLRLALDRVEDGADPAGDLGGASGLRIGDAGVSSVQVCLSVIGNVA